MAMTSAKGSDSALPDASTEASSSESLNPGATAASLVASLDVVSSSRIESLGRIHQARLASQMRRATDAAAQYGASSQQAINATASVTATKTTVGRIEIVHRQVVTPDPTVSSEGWVLHGRVYDAALTPLARYTVYLIDTRNRYVDAYGYSYTDDTGYFLIRNPGQQEILKKRAPRKAPPAAEETSRPKGAASSSPAAAKSQAADSQDGNSTESELFVAIANDQALPVFLGTTAFVPLTGHATYQNFTLEQDGKPMGDPPNVVRAAALPPSP